MTRFRHRKNPLAPPVANATSPATATLQQRIRAAEVAARSTRMPACSAYRNAAVNHTSTGNWQAVTWDSEAIDNDGVFAASSTTFTIVTPGIYLVTAQVTFAANVTGVRSVRLMKNAAATLIGQYEQTATAGAAAGRAVTGLLSLAASDALTIEAFQNSGGNLAYTVGAAYMHFDIVMVSSS